MVEGDLKSSSKVLLKESFTARCYTRSCNSRHKTSHYPEILIKITDKIR